MTGKKNIITTSPKPAYNKRLSKDIMDTPGLLDSFLCMSGSRLVPAGFSKFNPMEIYINGATEILSKLAGAVTQEIGLAWGVKDDLKKLQKTLQMLLAVITDAERKQVRDEAVRLWLRRLKDIAYDADDVLDDFCYETMRRCERGERLKHKVLDFVSSSNPLAFRFKMARKIKNINKSLDEITKDMDTFRFQITAPSNTAIAYGESSEERRRHTTSLSSETDIVGREEDKKNLVNILTKVTPLSSDRNPENVSVVLVVGMGGLGKTTLAQLVYADELIKMQFELIMWVHVSEYFDVENLLIKIMESTIQNKFDSGLNLDVLVKKVQENLRSKKYFLVLDDLWNEDQNQWDRLKSVLLVGAPGSKILITTRKDQVASIVSGGSSPYKLKQLSDGVCWSMIEKRAFSHGGALYTQEMTDIGKEIAKKCCGLPLAAKFLGSLLRSKNKKSDWISIRDDDIWNTQDTQGNILPTLRLSYNNLPSHLKQCFSFCAIFPKNWEIRKETLVQLWMAEGFLKPETKRSIEDSGSEYFETLVWSSFFHFPQTNGWTGIETWKMHDLVHDLAVDVLGDNELVTLKVSELKDVSQVRRLQLLDAYISTTFLRSLGDANKLRSVFVPEGYSNLNPSIFSRCKHLRVLHVSSSGNFHTLKLPHLRLKLTHLRYLHLTNCNFREADRYISKLYNLETLVLTRMVGIQNLLTNIQSLRKLRYLDITSSRIEELPDSVTSLCDLQSLNLSGCQLKSLPDSVTGMKYLRFLDISANLIEELPTFVTTLRNLEILNVRRCFKLEAIPDSLSSLDNLKIFNLGFCGSLKELPEQFGALPQLRYLNLEGTRVKVLPDSCADLINLEFLELGLCEAPKEVTNWKKLRSFHYFGEGTPMGIGELVFLRSLSYWVGTKEGNNGIAELGKLDLLEELSIKGLEKVKCLTDAKIANLKGKQNLRNLGLKWGKAEDLSIGLTEVLQPPTGLTKLTVDGYNGANFPEWMCDPSCLPNVVSMVLENCSSMEKLPAAIGQLSSLRALYLTRMPFKSLDVEFPFLRKLKLTSINLPELSYSYPCLQSLSIWYCPILIKIPQFPCLTELHLNDISHRLVSSIERTCTSLTELTLMWVRNFEFFPLSILQKNRNLQSLIILGCPQFQGFRLNDVGNENEVGPFGPAIQHGSIQSFAVRDCPVLKFLPDLRGWTSLRDLFITECPQLKESLTYDLKSLSSLQSLRVDFIQRDEHGGDPIGVEDYINLLL